MNKRFKRDEPGKACISDLTYIPTKERFLYLTVVVDLFDHKVTGWSVSAGMNADRTVIAAILMANHKRRFSKGMIFHSDRGVQYACKHTANLLNSFGVKRSMKRKGNCWDNSVAESFFKSFNSELIFSKTKN